MSKEPIIRRRLWHAASAAVSLRHTPLTFGEVGVKARVKSVMNYNKPVFWIILASVIACAVTAVCFLTNPISGSKNPLASRYTDASSVTTWFDYFDAPNELNWDGRLEIGPMVIFFRSIDATATLPVPRRKRKGKQHIFLRQ